ncbi:MAG: PIG-L family deacetylase [Chloroflexota bacterium]
MNPTRWIYISPHFDDAVLSCGGLIWEQTNRGMPVEIWTVFSGDPPPGEVSALITTIHQVWGTGTPEETVTLRRQEDRDAAAIVGASVRHLTFPDCIYRRSADGQLLYTEDVFAPRHPADAGLAEKISFEIAQELRGDDQVVCPFAIGSHLDHVLTRDALEGLKRPLHYYADIPYLLKDPGAIRAFRLGLRGKTYRVTAEGLRAWQTGFAAYGSQIKMLFETFDQMQISTHDYWAIRHGVRLWASGHFQQS